MWLIDTKTLELKFFTGSKRVKYAILSHTWEEEELSFQEFKDLSKAKQKKGFDKIARTCEIAREVWRLDYAWVDTCCINKESSAELSEAINSMFRWYHNSEVCFAYLSDLAPGAVPVDVQGRRKRLEKCRWFTRGWTLQELIAPTVVVFFDSEWKEFGRKAFLAESISDITGIAEDVLLGGARLASISVAKKMSWAARRQTTRDEDVAYCLLGMFDLNMPLLYGEGSKAFLRLQEEIFRQTNDLTMLAWTSQYPEIYPYEDNEDEDDRVVNDWPYPPDGEEQQFRGVFANAPLEFADCGTVKARPWRSYHSTTYLDRFTLTSAGLVVNVPMGINIETWVEGKLFWEPAGFSGSDYILKINCDSTPKWAKPDDMGELTMVIFLRQTGKGFVRTRFHQQYWVEDDVRWPASRPTSRFLALKHVSAHDSNALISEYLGSLIVAPKDPPELKLKGMTGPPVFVDPLNRVLLRSRDRIAPHCRIYLHFELLDRHSHARNRHPIDLFVVFSLGDLPYSRDAYIAECHVVCNTDDQHVENSKVTYADAEANRDYWWKHRGTAHQRLYPWDFPICSVVRDWDRTVLGKVTVNVRWDHPLGALGLLRNATGADTIRYVDVGWQREPEKPRSHHLSLPHRHEKTSYDSERREQYME